MKKILATPIYEAIDVTIEGIKYKRKEIKIVVNCSLSFGPIQARCLAPYFIMGSGFWDESFGKKQANQIRRICKQAIKNFIKKGGI